MKQINRKDFSLYKDFFLLKNENFIIRDICFKVHIDCCFFLSNNFVLDHIFFLLNKYKIKMNNDLILIILNEFISTCNSNLDYKTLNRDLSMVCSHYIEKHPVFNTLAAAFFVESLFHEVYKFYNKKEALFFSKKLYQDLFKKSIQEGVSDELFNPALLSFDLNYLAKYILPENDFLFDYMGIFSLHKRFFARKRSSCDLYELPQAYWMRVAMGLAVNEKNKNEKAKEFYMLMSSLKYIPSTPTLCHSGFVIPQLSSCYLSVVEDDLGKIFDVYGDTAQLAKWSGGIATAWTKIRACGAYIKKINLESQGLIPYLKIEDDIISSISKTGTRRGGKAVYLEVWHYDIDDFLDLKKNTGDHRRRTHDLNTALWISDLFMKRIYNNQEWTLFSPDETPRLVESYGRKFEEAYLHYEQLVAEGKIKLYRKVSAYELWKKILVRLFETGHPWITFKDAANIRSPQNHVGIIYSSNLCTEITLNTSESEIAVCNLGSINLKAHLLPNKDIDYTSLRNTVNTAIRMLDNVIDITYYPVEKAENSNLKHRPVGLGVMGWQDVLLSKKCSFESKEAIQIVDEVSEFISFHAIDGSVELAKERGSYSTYQNSLWDKGLFPHMSIKLLEDERGIKINMPEIFTRCDWKSLAEKMKVYGIRNSNLQAIAPTATISTIAGIFPSIEPLYKNLYVKSNLSGEFTIINKYLIDELTSLGLWNDTIIEKIKYYDGSILLIEEIPHDIRMRYKTAFEIDQKVLLHLTAIRSRWIDQSQSHNIFFEGSSGKELDSIYRTAWEKGLKTTYYLRTLGKSQIEKSTLGSEYGFTQKRFTQNQEICQIVNGEGCESCQ